MFDGNCIKCDVCGFIIQSFGCCLYGDERYMNGDGLCNNCRVAVKHAKEQQDYLISLKKMKTNWKKIAKIFRHRWLFASNNWCKSFDQGYETGYYEGFEKGQRDGYIVGAAIIAWAEAIVENYSLTTDSLIVRRESSIVNRD